MHEKWGAGAAPDPNWTPTLKATQRIGAFTPTFPEETKGYAIT